MELKNSICIFDKSNIENHIEMRAKNEF